MTTPSAPPLPDPEGEGQAEPEIVERPDGYYWLAHDGAAVGPFGSYEGALTDSVGDEEGPQPAENLHEAEEALGINDWLDPDTGEPAEGQSPPHIERE